MDAGEKTLAVNQERAKILEFFNLTMPGNNLRMLKMDSM